MTLTLGADVDDLTVRLTRGADFHTTLRNTDGPWPTGTTISLRFGPTSTPTHTWDATITGADAVFDIDKTDVDAVLAASTPKARLYYVNGDIEMCWAAGQVSVR